MIQLVLLVFAFVCFALSAWSAPHWNRLVSAGLAFLVASMLVAGRLT